MRKRKIIAIASSTGGPKALHEMIPKLSKQIGVPVIIVQHMPVGFTETLAKRLNQLSRLPVVEAAPDMVVEAGHVYVARGGQHLVVEQRKNEHVFQFLDKPNREGVKPCANYLFESLAESAYDEIICVVMTGMGLDGTEGIANLKKTKKVRVITQNEQSCAIYGMPKSVVKAGLSDISCSLEELAGTIEQCLNESEGA